MEKVIEKLEALKQEAHHKAQYGHTYYAGAYKAYHTAIELIKREIKKNDKN